MPERRARHRVSLVTLMVVAGVVTPAGAQLHSALWGADGERWTPESRLPDFSFAGYHSGEDPLPAVPEKLNVVDFGASGDDELDDTQAFKDAIAAIDRGAIMIPAGRYLITDILWIEKPGVVLRGEGPRKTVLHVPVELEDVRPNLGQTTSGRATSNYSWSGGFLWVRGRWARHPTRAIDADARRGDRVVHLADTTDLEPGARVVVEVRDDAEQSLVRHLYAGDPGDIRNITKPTRVRMVSRIASIDGPRVKLERPLRWDVRAAWSPTLRRFVPTVSEVGIEQLGIEFPAAPYEGHFTERGRNAIAINNASDCWVRDVRIVNCDSGVFASGVFCTIDRLTIDSLRGPLRGTTGHHGVTLGTDNLLQDFNFRTHFIHDITVTAGSAGNVVKNGRGTKLSLDHHKKANHENLFCNLDVGLGTEIWRCGGGAALGKHCGARGTFWCIRAERDLAWPPAGFAPDLINLVGVRTGAPSQMDASGRWLEAIPPEQLVPADLHSAQLARRLAHRAGP